MAKRRRYDLGNQLGTDMEQIRIEARDRWLLPDEICDILRNYNNLRIEQEPANKPSSGSFFLFNRNEQRYFRKDGHSWKKKMDGKTVQEGHEKLKVEGNDVLHCYNAHGQDNENFKRRSYWMLEKEIRKMLTALKRMQKMFPYLKKLSRLISHVGFC